jgi:hypothetical protein
MPKKRQRGRPNKVASEYSESSERNRSSQLISGLEYDVFKNVKNKLYDIALFKHPFPSLAQEIKDREKAWSHACKAIGISCKPSKQSLSLVGSSKNSLFFSLSRLLTVM